MSICIQCNKEYEAIRATSKFCSSKCRKLAFHENDKVSVPEDKILSVPESEYPPTQNEKKGLVERGKCHSCGKDVSDLICICLTCVQSGITHKSLGLKMCL